MVVHDVSYFCLSLLKSNIKVEDFFTLSEFYN